MAWIIERISLAEVLMARPARVYYAVHTCWWTHDPAHLKRLPGPQALPCDPRGSVLFQESCALAWLGQAEGNPAHYGRHGLRAFMAAHHLNCQFGPTNPLPWSLETWDMYNDLLDQLDAAKAAHPDG